MKHFGLEEALLHRKEESLYRQRVILDSPQGPEVCIGGKLFLAFCSNDYLGLANHPALIEALQKAVKAYGVGSGASNLIVGHSHPHHQLEEELAEFTGRPRALLFGTGYMANLGVMDALLGKGDAVFQDRLNHASLLDAGQLSGARFHRFKHRDLESLEQKLSKSKARRKLIATDGVFSMDGDQAPLSELSLLADKYQAALMLDDAHGFGVLGNNGRGSASHFGLGCDELPILMATLGKSLGTFGAFVAGSEALIETLIQHARSYIYTTAMPPAVAEATRTSLRIAQQEQWRREYLDELILLFRDGCQSIGLPLQNSHTPIQPVLTGSIEKTLNISQRLEALGILVTAIRPPTVPKGLSRLRVTLSAAHSKEHVYRLLDALAKMPWPLLEQVTVLD